MRFLFIILAASGFACSSTQTKEGDVQGQTATKLAATKDCNEDSFCTREYLPTTCQYSGQSFEGSNPCEAKKLARRYACEKDLKLADADVACKTRSETAETAPAAPAKKGQGK